MGQDSGQGAQGGASSNMYGQPTPGNSMQGYGGGAYGQTGQSSPWGAPAWGQKFGADAMSGGLGAASAGGQSSPWFGSNVLQAQPGQFSMSQSANYGEDRPLWGGGSRQMGDFMQQRGGDPWQQQRSGLTMDALRAKMGGGAAPDAPPPGEATAGSLGDGADPAAAAAMAEKASAGGGIPPWDAQRLGVRQDQQGWGRRMPQGRGGPWGNGMFGGGRRRGYGGYGY